MTDDAPVVLPRQERLPLHPHRLEAFATFFKKYMGVSTIVVAALPIPVTQFRLLPAYDSQRGLLSVYSSLFCFLVLAFVFFRRHRMGALMLGIGAPTAPRFLRAQFKVNLIPMFLLLASLACGIGYLYLLRQSAYVVDAAHVAAPGGALTTTSIIYVPWGEFLVLLYVGLFAFAEGAFVSMAVKEYVQDLLGISDQQMMHNEGALLSELHGK